MSKMLWNLTARCLWLTWWFPASARGPGPGRRRPCQTAAGRRGRWRAFSGTVPPVTQQEQNHCVFFHCSGHYKILILILFQDSCHEIFDSRFFLVPLAENCVHKVTISPFFTQFFLLISTKPNRISCQYALFSNTFLRGINCSRII